MKALTKGQSIIVSYKDREFDQIVRTLRQENIATQPTLIALVGLPKLKLEVAARDLAAALGKTLHRIDLHAISSKYIGETEKNLNVQFERAAVSRSILFFDEADDLFGRGSNVKDAHDRYGGTETNYLVERMSNHRGIIIALFNSLSEAERRRSKLRHLVVRFPPR